MATPAASGSCAIGVEVYSGTRQLFAPGVQIHYRLINGANTLLKDVFEPATCNFSGLPFHDNSVDNYTVTVSLGGHKTQGYQPIAVSLAQKPIVRLMLLTD